jgi:neogenin
MAFAPVDIAKHRGQHPLKSFSIPAPPSNTPMIPGHKQGKKVVKTFRNFLINLGSFFFLLSVPSVTVIRPQNSSPYKKSATTTPSASNRLQTGSLVPHSSDEVQMLRPSTSTEELNQEMANLEGLMKDLSAITASEFEC